MLLLHKDAMCENVNVQHSSALAPFDTLCCAICVERKGLQQIYPADKCFGNDFELARNVGHVSVNF